MAVYGWPLSFRGQRQEEIYTFLQNVWSCLVTIRIINHGPCECSHLRQWWTRYPKTCDWALSLNISIHVKVALYHGASFPSSFCLPCKLFLSSKAQCICNLHSIHFFIFFYSCSAFGRDVIMTWRLDHVLPWMNWNSLQGCQLEIFCFRAITTVKNLLEQCDQIPSPPRSHPLVPLRRWGYETTPLAPVYTLNGSFSYCAVFLRSCIEVPTPLSILSSLKSLSGYFSSFLLLSFLSISLSFFQTRGCELMNIWSGFHRT